MDIRITPSTLSGSVKAIPSKSQAQRALICAAVADRPSDIYIRGASKDMEATLRCIRSLGAGIRQGKDGKCHVQPLSRKGKGSGGSVTLNCGESGATLRFLLPVAAALRESVVFVGEGKLPQRPLEPLKEAMKARGCSFKGEGLPLTVNGRLKPGVFHLPGDVSSQFVTGRMLAAAVMKDDSEIVLTTHLESEDYVDLTIDVLERFGIAVYENPEGYKIPGKQHLRAPKEFRVEGDWSNAAFWLAASAMKNKVNVDGLNQKSVQGDRRIVSLLRELGGGAVLDVSDVPDLVPPLAVVASVTQGVTRFENAGRLRLKECDRLSALKSCLSAIGADVTEFEDCLVVTGRERLSGGEASSFGDHRMVMALAIAATVCENPVVIRGAEAVEKSYPTFFDDYKKLGGKFSVIKNREKEPAPADEQALEPKQEACEPREEKAEAQEDVPAAAVE